jgi:hypothetical protein
MTRRTRRVVAPPRATSRSKAKEEARFPILLKQFQQEQLSQSDVHKLLEFIYARYEGEYRYFNRILKDKGQMIV